MAVRSRHLTQLGMLFWIVCVGSTPSFAGPDKSWFASTFQRWTIGVNIDGSSSAKEPEKSYTTRLTKEDGVIVLKGQVPSDNDLKLLQGIVAATSPGTPFADKSKLNTGIIDRDVWLSGMTYALRQLAKLESGSVILKNNGVCLNGTIKADDDFASVQQKVVEELPKGLTLDQVGIRPATVRPFVWLAQLRPGSVSLSGHVPDEFGVFLVAYAKSLFKPGDVDNTMATAGGAPEGWFGAAKLALEMLNLLQQGRVVVSDRVIRLDGVFSGPGMSDVLRGFNDRLPKGFRLETNIIESALRSPAVQANDERAMTASPASVMYNR